MSTYIRNEVVWLPSQEDVVVKKEEEDPLESWTDTQGHSNLELIECKPEIPHEIYIKQESEQHTEDGNSLSLHLEQINYPKYKTEDILSNSKNNVHLDEHGGLILNCPFCGSNYIENDRKAHMACCNQRFSNSLAGPSENSPRNLKEHGKKHNDEKCFVCDVCNKIFNTKQHLTTHGRTHTGEKPFSCELCDKKFSVKGNLIKHMLTHSGDKPFSCDLCSKQFAQKYNLTLHKRRHTGEKPFSCDACEKEFTQKEHLNKHRRIHTGEKPFGCEFCHKQFAQKGDRNRHRLTHTGEKPFSCDVCGREFIKKSNMKSHRKIHNREKPTAKSKIHQ